MGFHKLYADLLKAELSGKKNIALLGDQEIVTDEGNWLPFSIYFRSMSGLTFDVFEHPHYNTFKNDGRHITLDLSTVTTERLEDMIASLMAGHLSMSAISCNHSPPSGPT